jgi:hypothetical protein
MMVSVIGSGDGETIWFAGAAQAVWDECANSRHQLQKCAAERWLPGCNSRHFLAHETVII